MDILIISLGIVLTSTVSIVLKRQFKVKPKQTLRTFTCQCSAKIQTLSPSKTTCSWCTLGFE
jgi:hypothetical protein